MAAAALALIVANSPLAGDYFTWLHIELFGWSVHHIVNDGLMAIFFLLVGLEIKREFLDGHLCRWSDRALAVDRGGGGHARASAGLSDRDAGTTGARTWLGDTCGDRHRPLRSCVLALLGPRVPGSLKIFLTTVAIADDLGAVAIIALAYSNGISGSALLAAGVILAVMFLLNRNGVSVLWPYLVLAVALWCAVLFSGVHATVAGVLAASAIPIKATPGAPDAEDSPLHRLEHAISPWVAYAIVPLFGFANAGVSLGKAGLGTVLAPLPLGVAAGLFIGKQIGIFLSVGVAIALRLGTKPTNASWLQIYGVALLCGIGFTMSLFIGGLAFSDPALVDQVKIGVLAGSLLSAMIGYAVLIIADSKKPGPREADRIPGC